MWYGEQYAYEAVAGNPVIGTLSADEAPAAEIVVRSRHVHELLRQVCGNIPVGLLESNYDTLVGYLQARLH